MGLFDKIKDLADEHADKVEDAIDKVADVVDDKTGGKYSDQIAKGAEKAKGLVGDDPAEPPEPPSRLTP
jgi:hypothetical protein